MKQLLRSTNAYRAIAADAARGECSHAVLVLFPDEKYLRALLRECAKAFFSFADGTRGERLVEEEHYSDALFFPEAGGKLTVDHASRILDESVLRPVEGTRKLFVLDAFHSVTPLVQNKLLKVLEEPPAGVYFLLGATAEYPVLPTVLSRVKKLAVPPFSEEQIEGALSRTHGGEGAREAAAASGGIFSVAENLLAGGGEDFRLAERFLLTEEKEKFCRELNEKQDKRAFFAAVRLVLRDAMLVATGGERYAARKSKEVYRIARQVPAGALTAALPLVAKAEREIQFNANFGQCALALAIGIQKETERWSKLS